MCLRPISSVTVTSERLKEKKPLVPSTQCLTCFDRHREGKNHDGRRQWRTFLLLILRWSLSDLICWRPFDLRTLHLALVIISFHIIAFTYCYNFYNFYKTILMPVHRHVYECVWIYFYLCPKSHSEQILSIRQTIKHVCYKPDPLCGDITVVVQKPLFLNSLFSDTGLYCMLDFLFFTSTKRQ